MVNPSTAITYDGNQGKISDLYAGHQVKVTYGMQNGKATAERVEVVTLQK